jgi:glycosyltransferase involved in cell wall biosynthesis
VQRLKIAYITIVDPNNRHSWSGTNYYLLHTLRKYIGDVDTLGPAEPTFAAVICKAFNFISLRLFGRRFDYRHSRFYAKACSALFQKRMQSEKYDLVVCPGNIASVAYLQSGSPVISVGDRTVAASLNYHRIFQKLWPFSVRQSLDTERRALHNCTLNIYPSPWAVRSAREAYNLPEEKLLLLPFGANIDHYPAASRVAQRKKSDRCRLLFIGVDWHDKGGPVAVDCLQELLKLGVDATLTVVGCEVPSQHRYERVLNYKFLSKDVPEQAAQLEQLFRNSDIFILPTRIDAYGLVFCEASAYGIPSFGANTGGVSGALHEGVNGFLLPHDATGADYAARIAGLFKDEEKYLQLSRSSRTLFEQQLNWDAFGAKLREVLVDRKIIS